MTNQANHPGNADSTKPFLYALFGTVLLAIGGMLFASVNGDPDDIFMVVIVAFAAPGFYLLIAAAVARGIVLSR